MDAEKQPVGAPKNGDHDTKFASDALEMDHDSTMGDGDIAANEAEEKALLRRIDIVLIPIMFFTFMLNFMDKTTLNSSAILGIIQDIKLVGQDFSWASSVFYFGYLAAEFPLALLLVKFPLGKVLSVFVMIWGIILGCHAAASNFATLCALRVLLGIGEAAIVPGFTLLTGLFYKPSEHASRHGLWFYGNSFGGMFGALIAYGCAHITGGPLAAWKWLFIALGMVTFLWGLFIFFILPDSPLTARFLKPAQRPIANRRSQKYMHSYKSGTWSNAQFLEAMKDPKTWFLFGSITVSSLTNGVVSNFTSLIIKGLGYSTLQTLLLGMPLYGFQLVSVAISMYCAAKIRKSRIIIIMVGLLIGILGTLLIRQLPSHYKAGRYAGIMLLLATTSIFPLLLSLITSNVAGITKKATVNAVFLIGYCAGNIAGPQFFIIKEAPTYETAFTALLVLFCVTIGILAAFRIYLARENKRRDTDQGVFIDPEPRTGQPSLEDRDTRSGLLEESDWENKNFRYHL